MDYIDRKIICNENAMNKKKVKIEIVKMILNHSFDDLGDQTIIKLK
jgi:hypothetical protein